MWMLGLGEAGGRRMGFESSRIGDLKVWELRELDAGIVDLLA